jgi:uncharacterized protein (DUF952 family)
VLRRLRLLAQSGFTGVPPSPSQRHVSLVANSEQLYLTVEIRGAVPTTIYKICEAAVWREAERGGVFRGAGVDERDGFIHFSTAGQVGETAARHFAGAADLMLVAVDADALAGALKWEVSRGGDLFPHLYGDLPLAAVRWTRPLPLGHDQRHVFPELEP